VRHGFERRETKSFAARGQRWISKNSRSPKLSFQNCCFEDWPAKNDSVARRGRASSQLAQISFTFSAPPWNPSNQQLGVSNRQIRRGATARMLLPEGSRLFPDAIAPTIYRRNRQKCAEHDGDFHCACKIASSEAAARLI